MDRTKRIICNPDGTIYLKRSNDDVVLIGKDETIIVTEVGFDPIDKQKMNNESIGEMLFSLKKMRWIVAGK
ncbi:hypothetical protein ACI2OX_16135 [Bacillus sp. N9]